MLLIGQPSISIRAIYTMAMLNNQMVTMIIIQCEAPKIAKLVNITPISLWFMADITILNGVYKPTYTGGHLLLLIMLTIITIVC